MNPPHTKGSIQKHSQSPDISENYILEETPEILDILLRDRITSHIKGKKFNIIWANDNYTSLNNLVYAPRAEIKPESITGKMGKLIMPRALKSASQQKERTKSRAEVFTPLWMVKKQNDQIEQDYLEDDLETYVRRTWLEITCGEAPYMVSRYDMMTGKKIPLSKRVGFIDRKLQRINQEVKGSKKEWQRLVTLAYQSSYGFEWNGDSLLLARENLLYTCQDYYIEKWQEPIPYEFFKKIATIISYNVFQMDGIGLTTVLNPQLEIFQDKKITQQRVKIKNWQTGKLEFFSLE